MSENPPINAELKEKLKGLEPEPDFEGGNFSMILSDSPSGFELQTDKSMSRHDENFPNPLGQVEKAKIKANYPGQMRFTTGNLAQESQSKLRKLAPNASPKEIEDAQIIYSK